MQNKYSAYGKNFPHAGKKKRMHKIFIFESGPHAGKKTRMRSTKTPHAVEKELDLDQKFWM